MTRKTALAMTVTCLLLLTFSLAVPGLWAETTDDAALIRLQGFTFDPLAGEPELGPSLKMTTPAAAATHLVQFRGPVQDEWKAAVEKIGGRLYGYLPDFAFIARLDAAAAQQVSRLSFVRWVGLYHPGYRLAPDLMSPRVTAEGAEAATELTMITLPDADLATIERQVESLGGVVRGRASNQVAGYMRVALSANRASDLAQLDNVLWVESYVEPQLTNDVGGGIMRADQIRQDLGLYGAGQTVAVADSGLDLGDPDNLHPDFQGRLAQAYCLGRPDPCNWSDRDGHGTHVAGSVLGSGAASGSNPASHEYAGSYAGVAPEARLVMQSLDDEEGNLGGIPDDRGDLMRQAYADGARIHTNSWGGATGGVPGSPEYGGYVAPSQQVDAAMWEQKDMLVLYSAGNNGADQSANGVVDPDSLGQPGTAKNVLTVGASENYRPAVSDRAWGDMLPDRYPVNPIAADLRADAVNGMAPFSSRGPTDDGRIKPDVTAPGTFILSARSQHPNVGDGWGPFNQYYNYQGGTSMSTPLTAGAAAVVRQWLTTRGGVPSPSGALMKAVLINGAVDMSPGQYGAGAQQETPAQRPNIVNGWGRVDLVESLAPDGGRQVWVKDETGGLGTGGNRTYQLTVGGGKGQSAASTRAQSQPVGQGGAQPAALTVNLLQNGGFESDAAWDAVDMDYTSDAAHSGSRSMASFPGFDGYVYQLVQVPANATAATLSYWWRNADGDLGWDILQASIYTSDLSEVIGSGPEHSTEDANWHSQAVNLGSILGEMRGQTVAVVFDVRQDGVAPDATLFIDDVALDVQTGGGATPTPTATRPPGPTPTPTATRPPTGGEGLLRITLAWTDYPGEPEAAKALVNDLDLEVIAPDGTRYRGNAGVYTGGQCLRGGQWDACNNVEGVIIPDASSGVYQVIVRGANVPQGPQPFALAASGDGLRQGGSQPTATPTRPGDLTKPMYMPMIVVQ
jgi:hypothetical protein